MSAISQRYRNMITRVATMVTTPVKSCAKPISSPSERSETSVTTRLIRSPRELPSTYLTGTRFSLVTASSRIFRTTENARRLVSVVRAYSAMKMPPIAAAKIAATRAIASKSTSPMPTM